MTGLDQLKVEVEFTAGVWTDLSGWVDWSAGGSLHIGRSTQFEAPGPGMFSVTLDNTDGRFSPQRQTLNDGTVHPYWPNVVPRLRIRFSWVISGTAYPQFLGFLHGWPTSYSGRKPIVVLSAIDRLDQLQRVRPLAPLAQEVAANAPTYYWPMDDSADGLAAAEFSGGPALTELPMVDAFGVPAPQPLQWGVDGPGVGNGTGVGFFPVWTSGISPDAADYLSGSIRMSTNALTIECWMKPGKAYPPWSPADNKIVIYLVDAVEASAAAIFVNGSGRVYVGAANAGGSAFATQPSGTVRDNYWHHVAFTVSSAGVTKLYVDGALSATGSTYALGSTDWRKVLVGGPSEGTPYYSNQTYQGSVAQVAVHKRALTAGEVANRYNAGSSWRGETSTARIARFLALAGVSPTDQILDTSDLTLSSYAQGDNDVLTAIQAVCASEGDGSAFYIDQNGKSRFLSRDARKPGAPVVTLDAAGDLDGGTYEPSFDDATLVNFVSADRLTASGTASTQSATDAGSVATYQKFSASLQSYAISDTDVLALAQGQVAAQAYPSFRLNRVTVDLFTTQNAILTGLAAASIGNRIRVQGMDRTSAPRTQVDLLIEGWTDAFGVGQYARTFDTSPADAPAVGLYDDAVYGRYGAVGITLAAAVTNSATSFSITTDTTQPKFTTDAGQYPMPILINTEVMSLTAAPSGAGSTQTVTVVRGQYGTTAAAQAINSPVDVWPIATYGI